MPARSHPMRPAPGSARPTHRTTGAGTRLPWWAVALPAVAFAALLTVVAGPADAAPASAVAPAAQLLGRLQELLPQLLSHLL